MGCDAASADPAVLSADAVRPVGTMPPPPSVLDLDRVQMLCVLAADGRSDRLSLQTSLCEAAVTAARAKVRLPVVVIGVGDPKLLDPTALSILVQASLTNVAGQSVLTATARGYRTGSVEAELFGPAPVAIPLDQGFASAVDQAMRQLVPPLLP